MNFKIIKKINFEAEFLPLKKLRRTNKLPTYFMILPNYFFLFYLRNADGEDTTKTRGECSSLCLYYEPQPVLQKQNTQIPVLYLRGIAVSTIWFFKKKKYLYT